VGQNVTLAAGLPWSFGGLVPYGTGTTHDNERGTQKAISTIRKGGREARSKTER
jgi:hypothetical protein